MDSSSIEDTLDEVLAEFRTGSGKAENGLNVVDPALLQLKKSCRMLEAVDTLKEQNGYFTVIIEGSFAAIERSIQFYLQENGYIREDEFVDHCKVYEFGENAGLYGTDFKRKLIQLWENNRSRTYYREGVGTEQSARLMVDLAEQIHCYILQLAGESHECICATA